MNIIGRLRKKIYRMLKEKKEWRQFRVNVERVRGLAKQSRCAQKYIVDCGFNEGVVADRLLEELEDFSLRGFEVQQDIQEFSERLKKKYSNRDIEVIYAAVSNANGKIEYFEPDTWGKNYKGSTTVVANKKALGSGYLTPRVAPAIDFSAWLVEKFSIGDFLFVKMDIEGAEYDVIESLLNTGAIDLIDVLAVEWHADKFEEPQATRYRDIENRVSAYAKSHSVTLLDWY